MLMDMIVETDRSFLPGLAQHSLYQPVLARLASAVAFVMDADAITMAAGVSQSKPSSLVAALPYVRLPAERVWIEYSNEQLSKAMAELGSPNADRPGSMGRLHRSGFLLEMQESQLIVEYVHAMRVEGEVYVELSSVRGIFDTSDLGQIVPGTLRETPLILGADKVKASQKLLTKDPIEAGAFEQLHARFDWAIHPDLEALSDAFAMKHGAVATSQAHAGWLAEMKHQFFLALLPSLVLINAKNALEPEPGEPLDKINKQRLKKGKPALREHLIYRLKLTKSQHRIAASSGAARAAVRGSLVIGHFKLRKSRTGHSIHWWSMHSRNGYVGPGSRVYRVSR